MQTPSIPKIPEARDISTSMATANAKSGDIFESVDENDEHSQTHQLPDKQADTESAATFDQLPIEIRSLTER